MTKYVNRKLKKGGGGNSVPPTPVEKTTANKGVWPLTSPSTIFQLYRGGVLLVEETGVSRENHRPVASH